MSIRIIMIHIIYYVYKSIMYYINSCICIITYHSEDIQSTVMIYGKINVTIYIYIYE